jgi:general nucleoside transport system permease protein
MERLIIALFSPEFLSHGLRFATPLILAAMGAVVNERSGVLNLGLDGMMLVGAFTAFTGSFFTGNPWLGVLFAVIVCMIMALFHAFATITLVLNQVIMAVAINIFSLGITSSLLRLLYGTRTSALRAANFTPVPWPEFLVNLPVIGVILFRHTIFTYIAILMVPFLWWVFFKTTWGLKLRAVGEYPKAAATMGINVARVRYLAMLWAGLMAGLAGASLSLTVLRTFIDDMTAGRGFIAFATVIFGRFHPVGAALGALFFGLANGLQLRAQAIGLDIPYQLLIMFPYLVTILLLVLLGKGSVPAGWGEPYYPDNE